MTPELMQKVAQIAERNYAIQKEAQQAPATTVETPTVAQTGDVGEDAPTVKEMNDLRRQLLEARQAGFTLPVHGGAVGAGLGAGAGYLAGRELGVSPTLSALGGMFGGGVLGATLADVLFKRYAAYTEALKAAEDDVSLEPPSVAERNAARKEFDKRNNT